MNSQVRRSSSSLSLRVCSQEQHTVAGGEKERANESSRGEKGQAVPKLIICTQQAATASEWVRWDGWMEGAA